jgi:hypothetical protein
MLDGGGCTMISALLNRVVSGALGTIMTFGSAGGMARHPGGSLLIMGAGALDWHNAVIP